MLGVEGKVNLPAPESNINADEDPGPLEPPETHVVAPAGEEELEAVRQQLGPLPVNSLLFTLYLHPATVWAGPPALFLRGEAIHVAMTALGFTMAAPQD
jgi:hypothetical protein